MVDTSAVAMLATAVTATAIGGCDRCVRLVALAATSYGACGCDSGNGKGNNDSDSDSKESKARSATKNMSRHLEREPASQNPSATAARLVYKCGHRP